MNENENLDVSENPLTGELPAMSSDKSLGGDIIVLKYPITEAALPTPTAGVAIDPMAIAIFVCGNGHRTKGKFSDFIFCIHCGEKTQVEGYYKDDNFIKI